MLLNWQNHYMKKKSVVLFWKGGVEEECALFWQPQLVRAVKYKEVCNINPTVKHNLA